MNIFEYAMQMEQDGEAYYRDMAAKTSNKGLRTILTFLADEEVKHYEIFKSLSEGKGGMLPPSSLTSSAKNIFRQMRESGDSFDFEAKQTAYYEKAQQMEQQAVDFYTEKAAETDNTVERELLLRIAEEEKKHFELFGAIKDFISQPERWLENAEWNHLVEY